MQFRNMACILISQEIVVPSLFKKALGTSFNYFRDSFFQILLVTFFTALFSLIRGLLPLLQWYKLASLKSQVIAKQIHKELSNFQVQLKGKSALFSVPSTKYWFWLLRTVSYSLSWYWALLFVCLNKCLYIGDRD